MKPASLGLCVGAGFSLRNLTGGLKPASTQNLDLPRRLLAATLLLALLVWAPALFAHEMGTTRVNATFGRDGSYRIEMLVDPEALLERLNLIAGGPPAPTPPPGELPPRVTASAPAILRQVEVWFDGTRVTPALRYVPLPTPSADPTAVTGLLRFEGAIPRGATAFRWRYLLPYTSYLLTLNDEASPGGQRQWVEGDALSKPFVLGKRAAPSSRSEIALMYVRLGFTHIIPKGADHILFVLGIFFLSTRWRDLLAQVTAFTIAHSVTLALSVYEVVSLSSSIVEPLIALSIAYVGFENVATRTVKPWRVALVFAFGLLHGLGFAGVLEELGIPRSEFVTALLAFNIGVELGQLAVVGLAFLLFASWARKKPWYRQRVVIPLSILIGLAGVFWTIERSAW